MSAEAIHSLIIGAGQAGLAMSYWLTQLDQPHLLVERGRIAERWRSERWDSLMFQFPNWGVELPGLRLHNDRPEQFAHRDEVVSFIERYARYIAAPVREGVEVRRLRAGSRGLVAETNAGQISATNAVVATGPYQRPSIPAAAAAIKNICQLHSSAYRNPDMLPDGGVLVVGAGASGAQIADELVATGRRVWLAVGSHRRVPRVYRGYDFHHWEFALGEWDRCTASRNVGEPPPLLTGAGGGRDMDLRELARRGITLTGRLSAVLDGFARFKPDLADSLAQGDAYYQSFTAAINEHAVANGLHPTRPDPAPVAPNPACVSVPLTELDLRAAGVTTIVWATGYGFDFSWVDLPAFSPDGAPIHTTGISPVPGLYFLGLPWLAKRKSTLLAGVGEDAERLARVIAIRGKQADPVSDRSN
jgi:putative flavoprotein involved in K+ transport